MAIRTRRVTAGKWTTLESFWNATSTAFFLHPRGAKVRVRYGGGSWWNGYTGEEKTLSGDDYVKLTVGIGSLAYARFQMRLDSDADVNYEVLPGQVARMSPELPLP